MFLDNPVWKREIKSMLKSWKTYLIITIYLLFLMGVSGITFLQGGVGNYYSLGLSPQGLSGGMMVIIFLQFGMLSFVAPSVVSGSINGERQRGTFDLLICTQMKTREIVSGKLLAGVSYIFLLLMVALPITSLLVYFAGVKLSNILLILGYMVIVTFYFASFSQWMSSVFEKSITSSIASIGFMLISYAGTSILVAVVMQLLTYNGIHDAKWVTNIFYLNPIAGMMSILSSMVGSSGDLISNGLDPIKYGHAIVCSLIYLSASLIFNINTIRRVDPKYAKKVME